MSMSVDRQETIDQFMQRELEGVPEDCPVIEAAARMAARQIGSLVVHRKGVDPSGSTIIGLVSETDMVRQVMAKSLNASEVPVGHIMATPLLSLPADRTMLDANHFMEQHGIRHLCISQGDAIAGLISVRDLVRRFVYAQSGPIRDLDDVYRPLSVLMRRNIETIDREETLRTAAKQMADKHIGALMVTQVGEIVGIMSERDLVQNGLAPGRNLDEVTVGMVMMPRIIDIDINRTVHDASDVMAERNIRHLAVTENHAIVGILSVRDLLRMISVRDRPRFLRQHS
jgi:signal-transduction protein with cAMP-binding, CBS, and nucleotidyltransferase domain